MLEAMNEGPMRDAFLRYRFNRAIALLPERDVWASDPLRTWFSHWDVVDLSADDTPARRRAHSDEKPKAGAHR